MIYFPEVIGIEIANSESKEFAYITENLFNEILSEIGRWPTIKVIEIIYSDVQDLQVCSHLIENINNLVSEQVKVNYLQWDRFIKSTQNEKNEYYKGILNSLEYCNPQLVDDDNKAEVMWSGEFSLETNSLFIRTTGAVLPIRDFLQDTEIIGWFPELSFGDLINLPKLDQIRHKYRMGTLDSKYKGENLSSILSKKSLRQFWIYKDTQEQIGSLEERDYIFNLLLQENHRAVRVDLGCGPVKRNGFIGVDRFLLPGVDIAADLNKKLPFEDDFVDLVYASHSLEHVKDIMFTMNEIYRICKHGAQICIVVPYSEQKLNYANPYHLQVFNEHTPRFWTDYPKSPIPKEEWVHPQGPFWGLSKSDHSSAVIDLRCVQMHFDYFPQFEELTSERKLYERKTKIDVCEQIMYHLVVIKKETSDEEFMSMVQKMEYYEPPYITIRKQKDENLRLTKKIESLNQYVEEAIVEKNTTSLVIDQLRADIEYQKTLTNQLQLDCERFIGTLEKSESANKNKEAELNVVQLQLDKTEHKIMDFNEIRKKAIHLATEKEMLQQTRFKKIRNQLSRDDLWKWVGESFSRLRDDSIIYGFKKPGYRLTLSDNLQNTPFLHYRISNLNGKLLGVYLAIASEINKCNGTVGIEILDGKGTIIQNSSLKLSECDVNTPVYIPVQNIILNEGEQYHLRVFGSNLEVPVKVYQFAKGKKTTPFLAFNFE